MAQKVKRLPAIWEIWVQSLGREDPLEKEKEIATHSSILPWKIPWMEEPCRLRSMGSQKVSARRRVKDFTHTAPFILPVTQ